MTQQSSAKSADARDLPEQCDRALLAGHHVRCVMELGHKGHHVGYGTSGDLTTTTWVQNDIRETIVPPPKGPEAPEPLTPEQKLALLAVALSPNPPMRSTSVTVRSTTLTR
jgi:hypothetical protein